MRISFEKVALHADKAGKCGCGKRRRRRKKFWGTLNPWNKNPDGTIRTWGDIQAGLRQQIEAWEAEPIVCKNCA